jgi:hypothetical protein
MNNFDIDVNVMVATFNEKIAALTTELVVKETIIKQLSARIDELSKNVNEGDDNV